MGDIIDCTEGDIVLHGFTKISLHFFSASITFCSVNMTARSDSLACVKDFETEACHNLPESVYEFCASGVGDEQTLLDNVLAYKRYV